ncbi:hypothetical protein SAMD00019534_011000 [Acytostelium subglobosum LB1]|uniref:hypothetical protein n=1 Tax=Acytostelium subglobosum LB1 TaxID=1410327 RepID=UPI000644E1C5|nr:hypothetical protein SAMD00019534_011000 [Acytostelium subglobosum LB1]GAM17925.1 hypothetical protein SAMD00019534_011000 [Acytostelium subglobosum LB1]|eukprot:XP_012758521.1 hypothetical protein SAMD00019534_011000 [Acytostelium subglobosum LB1]
MVQSRERGFVPTTESSTTDNNAGVTNSATTSASTTTTGSATSKPTQKPFPPEIRYSYPVECMFPPDLNGAPYVPYTPQRCSFLYDADDETSKMKSCCSQTDEKTFQARLDNIATQFYAPLYDCAGEKINDTGFQTVMFNGSTPDLITTSEYHEVLDTRYHAHMCMEHLQALQCVLCSVDQYSVLGRSELEHRPNNYHYEVTPIFYMNPFPPDGQPVVLCTEYFYRLSNYCQFLNVRKVPFHEQYKPGNRTGRIPFAGITANAGLPRGITNLQAYVTTDSLDVLWTSDYNLERYMV